LANINSSVTELLQKGLAGLPTPADPRARLSFLRHRRILSADDAFNSGDVTDCAFDLQMRARANGPDAEAGATS
jgi:hypothetical protein